MSDYNFILPLKIFGFILAACLSFTILFCFYVRKVTYTVGELKQENSYYEPREWAIVLTVIMLILAIGFVK